MGYLDRDTLTVDAILTKKGRELLAKGKDLFKVTQFALSDDEVDYTLWNENHPSGSAFYGYAIEQMPVLEAVSDETQNLRYKLVSLPKSTTRIPQVTISTGDFTLQVPGQTMDISPNTIFSSATGISLNQTLGYTVILHNSDVATLEAIETVSTGPTGEEDERSTMATVGSGIFLSDAELATSVFVTGFKFRITAKTITTTSTSRLTIIGNESGGSTSVNVTVNAINENSVAIGGEA